ncbi:hypothetical protein P7C71_g5782, partial [Lecanoromycetidae sp. Uapishka_2]
MASDTNTTYDYIVIGGGTAGCVLASRLLERQPSLSVLVIEAGSDITNHPHVFKPLEAALLHFSDIDFRYFTVPQKHLDNKPRYVCGVKALSGAITINAGGWIRGDSLDYDEWAQQAGDDRWTYNGLLPYFRRSEHHYDPNADPKQHGFEGPMFTSSVTTSGRKYPLRDTILKAWKSLGLKEIADANNGHPQGIAELIENRRDGLRQLTSVVYPLTRAQIMTETMVHRILLNDGKQGKVASGVELADGRRLYVKAGGEVLLCGGAYRSPQVLMLSGIGDKVELAKHGIPQQVDLPGVGKNFHDHQMIFRYWKLRHPEKGLAMGSPAFADPAFEGGNPADWLATMTVPQEGLKAAITITLESKDPMAAPVIDPNYCATEADRFVMREGWRVQSRLMLESPEGKKLVAEEILPEGHQCLASDASDKDIDKRIIIGGVSCSHPGASCSMGKVVDGSCKVYGVEGLRVVDASVIPVPLAAHYQAPVFALAEQAVDIILAEKRS